MAAILEWGPVADIREPTGLVIVEHRSTSVYVVSRAAIVSLSVTLQ
jgi:hypothetical protein